MRSSRSHTRLCLSLVVCGSLALAALRPTAAPMAAAGVTTCEAANPFDNEPDDVALQDCLDNYDWVLLKPDDQPGFVGYILSNTIKLKHDHILLTSGIPHKTTLVAGPDLKAPMLTVTGAAANNYEISFIRFNGNRDRRSVRDKPCDTGHHYENIDLSGKGFKIRFVESYAAVCGSGMVVGGASDFEIYGSIFADNGRQPEDAGGLTGLWSDGLTVYGCNRSAIHDNSIWDNTDVDLGVNGGTSCAVYRNTISHFWKYAFAGLVIGDPSQSGGEFSDNVVTSGENLLGFGILVGCHPWAACHGGFASDVWVHNNKSIGAVVNLAVDGVNGGRVENNSASGPRGDRVLNCKLSANYTAGHFFNMSSLQPGYVNRTFDTGATCQP